MTKDLKRTDWNEDIYVFINILISNYHENEVFRQLVEYFIFLNSIRGTEEIEDIQKPYFANLYKVFRGMLDNPEFYHEADYKDFLKRCDEIRNEKKNEERKNKIRERIQTLVTENEKKALI